MSVSHALLIVHPTDSHSSDSLIIFSNLHISPVYFNTSCTGPSKSRFVSSLLTLGIFLNTGDGGREAGGPVQEGFQCELTFLGVRIVQEQQADSSSGRSERSSLMMISIIQAICANRRCVFSSISSNRLVWQLGLLSRQSYLIIIRFFSPHKLSLEMTIVLCLWWSLCVVSMCWSQSPEMCSMSECDR